jgi:hypothetical protein
MSPHVLCLFSTCAQYCPIAGAVLWNISWPSRLWRLDEPFQFDWTHQRVIGRFGQSSLAALSLADGLMAWTAPPAPNVITAAQSWPSGTSQLHYTLAGSRFGRLAQAVMLLDVNISTVVPGVLPLDVAQVGALLCTTDGSVPVQVSWPIPTSISSFPFVAIDMNGPSLGKVTLAGLQPRNDGTLHLAGRVFLVDDLPDLAYCFASYNLTNSDQPAAVDRLHWSASAFIMLALTVLLLLIANAWPSEGCFCSRPCCYTSCVIACQDCQWNEAFEYARSEQDRDANARPPDTESYLPARPDDFRLPFSAPHSVGSEELETDVDMELEMSGSVPFGQSLATSSTSRYHRPMDARVFSIGDEPEVDGI